MQWKGRRQSTNVKDVRGSGGGGNFGRGPQFRIPMGGGGGPRRAGAGGISGIVILVILFFALRACGIDPMAILAGDPAFVPGGQQQTQTQGNQQGRPANDEASQFVSTVLAETEDVWNGIFQSLGQTYREPTLVIFSGQVQSACGYASAASGPFYCPGDQQVYIDLSFYDQMERQLGAGGDFAQAYVVAHEVGHHVQNLIGILPQFNQARRNMGEAQANEMSVRVELQADCFAGVWAYYTERKGLLDPGDVEEALNAAHQIGDDTIQRRTQGYVVPESFSHGTSEQRMRWFNAGMQGGRIDACDTFNNPI
ncbi:KPN_02809 family neutral zinc metallopeptidase [Limoniibacter endophyticus]|uniref:Flagellar biosynthesis protein FlgM n=1 Tax=Limoniibacter endophyticus TaxID=1565040 RepID=A0A8J3GGN3_9HYPH|nr:neutral zinc metallopeptidase [Limoniibacter endophyticus]GHC65942.1 flagellar biosynthesis protein FlgM [Limoniibacter endophyticus]